MLCASCRIRRAPDPYLLITFCTARGDLVRCREICASLAHEYLYPTTPIAPRGASCTILCPFMSPPTVPAPLPLFRSLPPRRRGCFLLSTTLCPAPPVALFSAPVFLATAARHNATGAASLAHSLTNRTVLLPSITRRLPQCPSEASLLLWTRGVVIVPNNHWETLRRSNLEHTTRCQFRRAVRNELAERPGRLAAPRTTRTAGSGPPWYSHRHHLVAPPCRSRLQQSIRPPVRDPHELL